MKSNNKECLTEETLSDQYNKVKVYLSRCKCQSVWKTKKKKKILNRTGEEHSVIEQIGDKHIKSCLAAPCEKKS